MGWRCEYKDEKSTDKKESADKMDDAEREEG
jgi:hypothetical protein